MKRLFLPLGLACAFFFAWLVPGWGQALNQLGVIPVLVALIFLVNGYQVRLAEVPKDNRFLWVLMATAGISLLLGPWLALYSAELLALPAGVMLGLVVIGCVPPTLSSCIVLTQLVGGYGVWALILSISLNILGVFSMPFMLVWVLGGAANINVDAWSLLYQLGLMVLLPFIIGIAGQKWLSIPSASALLQYLPSSCIVVGVWMAMSDSVQMFHELEVLMLLQIALAVLLLHLILLACSWGAGGVLRVERAGRIAMALAGSQKTLPVAISLLALMETQVGPALLVCITFHFLTLFTDAVIAPLLGSKPCLAAANVDE